MLWSDQIKNGTYVITATADATNVVPETNEGNNSLTRTFIVNGNKVTAQWDSELAGLPRGGSAVVLRAWLSP